jgi:hypothetical protein
MAERARELTDEEARELARRMVAQVRSMPEAERTLALDAPGASQQQGDANEDRIAVTPQAARSLSGPTPSRD